MDEDGVWRQAVEWLMLFEVLPEDHRCGFDDSRLINFVYTLRDGVLLCHLLHKIDPVSIDLKDVSLKPQMAQFLCVKNIRVFLTVCSKHFHIDEIDLFDPSMLFDYTDFGKVLRTLSVLSFTPKALSHGIAGFPRDTLQSSVFEEAIYRHLDEEANGHDNISADGLRLHLTFGRSDTKTDENIYEDLCYVSLKDQVAYGSINTDYHGLLFQGEQIYEELTGFQSEPQVVPSAAPLEKRDYCLNELLETEANYVCVLQMLRQKFLEPLKPHLSQDNAQIVFHGVKELEEAHVHLLAELRDVTRPGGTGRVSTVFLTNKSRFLTYGDYCSNLQRAQHLVDELCEQDESLSHRITKCQLDANGGKFKLRDLLSVPMQRILKYEILLRELLKHTLQSMSHNEDHSGLERAVAAMKDVAEFINEVKRDNETLQIMHDIQSSITGWTLDETRFKSIRDCGRLLKDGELKVKCHPDNKIRLRYVFIFDEILLMCKSTKGEQYVFKDVLVLRDYHVEDRLKGARASDARWSHHWHLVHRQNRTVYELFAKTDEMRNIWIRALEQAIDHVSPADCRYSDHQFQLHSFVGAEECDTCLKLLKGIFLQGYRCVLCDRKSHRHCIRASGMCGARGLPGLAPDVPDSESDICAVQLPHRTTASRSQQSSPVHRKGTLPARTVNRPASLCMRSASVSSSLNSQQPIGSSTTPVPFMPSDADPLPEYVNLTLQEQQWWGDEMDRLGAERVLEHRLPGTFLVRVSAAQDNKCVLSLRATEKVSHMKIREDSAGGESPRYSLSPARQFGSVLQLVQFYQRNSLSENFSGLHMTLGRAWRQEDRALVKFKYSHHGHVSNVLSLNVGDEVTILSRDGEAQGWWKGRVGDRTGYFPKSYVQEIP